MLIVKHSDRKGRGIYASCPILPQTTVEVSPVLLFSKDEYEEHGRHTILDHYAFKWSDGRMALALGLGSLFNHSDKPNTSYTIDTSTNSIRYIAVRQIEPDEELCIFYGHKLWFTPAESSYTSSMTQEGDFEDGWGGLLAVDDPPESSQVNSPFSEGDPNQILLDHGLPFTRFKLCLEEEEMDTIRTIQAWVVDIPDQRQIANLLKWLKRAQLDTPDLGHLKRIRKQDDQATFLLTTSPIPPALPEDLHLPEPYTLPVPVASAVTCTSLKLKSSLWPTLYTPSRKDEAEIWSRGKARWAWEAMSRTITAANEARAQGELPIAAHIAVPYEDKEHSMSFTAWDSRTSSAHPLRHAVLNLIRRMADYRADNPSSQTAAIPEESIASPKDPEELRNGTNYLLTSLSLFTTHEPCIMCSMALIHSRVKEVFYLHPMLKTGGCGGAACLPTLKGVNHRFGICQWKVTDRSMETICIDPSMDA